MNDPILVVGAGPVGLVAATELARGGVPVRIIDLLPEPSPWSKAVAVHPRSMELLRSLGVSEEILAAGVTVPGVSLVSGDKALAEADFASVESAYPYMVCIPQDATEAILTAKLWNLGVEIERGVKVVSLTQDETSVTATLRHADGEAETPAFSYVAGCDGGHSTVRHLVGTELQGTFHGVSFLLADCDADHDLDRHRMYLFFHESGHAAHIHSPAGGQGMNTGMQDAANLGWKLRLAWADVAAPGLLDSFHAERHPVGASVVHLSTLMTRGGTARGATAQHARNLLASLILGHTRASTRLVDRIAETSIAYHESPMVGGLPRSTSNGGLRPGDHAPDAGGLVNLLNPTVHTAVHVADKNLEPSRTAAAALRKNFGTLVRNVLVVRDASDDDGFDDVLADPAGAVAARYGAKDGLLVIIRPDGYIAFLGEPVDLPAAERLLSTTIV